MPDDLTMLLNEFVTCDAIANYDSSCCWGCGELKMEPCLPDCLLERSRRALSLRAGGSIPSNEWGTVGECPTRIYKTMTFLLIFAFIVSWLAICTSFLLVIAYRDRARQAIEAANRNAGYWAQAAEKAELVEAHNERLGEIMVESQKTMGKMTEHAREALRLAKKTHADDRYGRTDIQLPYQVREMDDDDVLNAREISE